MKNTYIIDYSAIGSIYWQRGEVQKALDFLNEILNKCADLEFYCNLPLIVFTILQIHIDQKQYD